MEKILVTRKEVPIKETWDLSLIYETEAAMEQDAERMQKLTEETVTKYKGHLDIAKGINACLDSYREILRLVALLNSYTELSVSVDHYDAQHLKQQAKIGNLVAEVFSKLSFIESEIVTQDEAVLKEAIALAADNKHYMEEILRGKPYQLHPEAERVLAALAQTMEAPYTLYEQTKLADMQFDSFEAGGREYPLGYSLFEDNYEYDSSTPVRRAAFRAFSNKLRQYENTTAAAYQTQVQKEKTIASLRGYPSVFDYLLFEQRVSRDLYDRQIDVIMEKLAPHMRKYAALLKKVHGLEQMTFADLKITVDPEYDPHVTIEESQNYMEQGLAVMGEDYVQMIRTAYQERWVDFAQNKGKSTGGFCESPYGKGSFILLSWHNRMADVFTLAHELGHAGHFKSCNSSQSIFDTQVSTYFVEAPSTMNELIMAEYLLKTNPDKRFRRWVLSCMISNTYYHNFVTHLIEAAYQREVYRIIDEGGSVQAETLNQIMKETLGKFWGDGVEIGEGAELTWMRQPHYYMGLYSYTYSAGLTVATQVNKRIQSEGQQAVEDWKKVLTAGSTLTPVELAKLAKVDITTDAPLLDTIETIGEMIEEICQLTEELEKG